MDALQYRWSHYNIDGRIKIQMVALRYRWSYYNIDGRITIQMVVLIRN